MNVSLNKKYHNYLFLAKSYAILNKLYPSG